MRPRGRVKAGIAILGVLAASCARDQSSHTSSGTLAAVYTAVGPVPGTGAAAADPPNPVGSDAVVVQAGQRLFQRYNCAGCHGEHGGGGMGPSLRDSTWIYGASNPRIFSSIAEGRAHGMPAWGARIPEQQIWELVAYIRSLRTPREPEPPH